MRIHPQPRIVLCLNGKNVGGIRNEVCPNEVSYFGFIRERQEVAQTLNPMIPWMWKQNCPEVLMNTEQACAGM